MYVSNARRVRELHVMEVYPLLHLAHLWNSRLFAMHLDTWSFRTRHNNALRKIILDCFFRLYMSKDIRIKLFSILFFPQKLVQINLPVLTMKLGRCATIIIVFLKMRSG